MTRAIQVMRHLSRACAVLGLGALGYVAYVAIDAHHFQAAARAQLAEAAPVTAAIPPLAEGDPIGELEIPRLALSTVVVQGESEISLRRAAGHLADSPLPGEPGNVAIAGHRDTIFRALRDVRVGDTIVVRTPRGVFTYAVESTAVVPPTDLRVLDATSGRTLTLITCFPFTYIGAAPNRFIVRARQVRSIP